MIADLLIPARKLPEMIATEDRPRLWVSVILDGKDSERKGARFKRETLNGQPMLVARDIGPWEVSNAAGVVLEGAHAWRSATGGEPLAHAPGQPLDMYGGDSVVVAAFYLHNPADLP